MMQEVGSYVQGPMNEEHGGREARLCVVLSVNALPIVVIL